MQKTGVYVMAILWVCYGYPMELARNRNKIGAKNLTPTLPQGKGKGAGERASEGRYAGIGKSRQE